MRSFKVTTLVVGVLQVNCYIFQDTQTNEAMIVDPGDEGDLIINKVRTLSAHPKITVNTHCHPDHTCANKSIKDTFNIPLAIGRDDELCLRQTHTIAQNLMLPCEVSPQPDMLLDDGDVISVGGFSFEIISTPGHTPGSICLHNQDEGILFSGDTLFYESVGRWDLEGGNYEALMRSLERLLRLPDDTIVYPGHGEPTTIGHEKQYNPFP